MDHSGHKQTSSKEQNRHDYRNGALYLPKEILQVIYQKYRRHIDKQDDWIRREEDRLRLYPDPQAEDRLRIRKKSRDDDVKGQEALYMGLLGNYQRMVKGIKI